jgi:hypothetical protein
MTEDPIGSVGEPNPRRYDDVLSELPAYCPRGRRQAPKPWDWTKESHRCI